MSRLNGFVMPTRPSSINLAAKLAHFAEDAGQAIGKTRLALPEALNDRAQDNFAASRVEYNFSVPEVLI